MRDYLIYIITNLVNAALDPDKAKEIYRKIGEAKRAGALKRKLLALGHAE